MKYKFTAITSDGNTICGMVDARDRYDALARIREEHSGVTRLVPVRRISELLNTEIAPSLLNSRLLSILCTQFAIILKSGISMTACIELIGKQMEHRRLKKVLKETGIFVAAGNSLAESFYLADKSAFPTTFLESVRAGEASGELDTVFAHLGRYYEKRYKMKQKVTSAMIYPLFVLAAAIAVVGIVMLMVVPTIADIFAELGGDLPLPTRILIGISEFLSGNWSLIGGVVFGGILFGMCCMRTEGGRIRLHGALLKLPVLGKIILLESSARFAHTMSVMLHSGLTLTRALAVTAKTLDNAKLANSVIRMSARVVEGNSLRECMRAEHCFPETLNEMCAMGEETGELEEMLCSIHEYLDNQTEFAAKKAVTMLEPILLLVMALVTGFIVISIYLPLFTMYDLM